MIRVALLCLLLAVVSLGCGGKGSSKKPKRSTAAKNSGASKSERNVPPKSQPNRKPDGPLEAHKLALKSGDANTRVQAAKALGALGPEAVTVLGEAINDQDLRVREEVVKALGLAGPSAIPVLDKTLRDTDTRIRMQAVSILQKLGAPAAPALGNALRDSDRNVRESAARALGGLEPSALLPVLAIVAPLPATQATTSDPGVYDVLIATIAERESAAISLGIDLAKMSGKTQRQLGLGILHGICSSIYSFHTPRSQSGRLRQRYAWQSDHIIPQGEEIAACLAPLLDDQDARLRVIELLGLIGSDARIAALPIRKLLTDSGTGVRIAAARSYHLIDPLGMQGVDPAELLNAPQIAALVEPLAERLASPRSLVRSDAIKQVTRLGMIALPALLKALDDPDAGVRMLVYQSISSIGPAASTAAPRLRTALSTLNAKNWREKSGVASALGGIGPPAKDAIPELMELLKSRLTKQAAAGALGRMGPDAKDAIPVMIKMLQEPGRRRTAYEALAGIGPDSVPNLIATLRNRDLGVRTAAAQGLGLIGSDAHLATSELIQMLREKDDNTLWVVIVALGQIGPKAKRAVPHLLRFQDSTSYTLKSAAAEALKRIQKQP